jgi:hypothetical protein
VEQTSTSAIIPRCPYPYCYCHMVRLKQTIVSVFSDTCMVYPFCHANILIHLHPIFASCEYSKITFSRKDGRALLLAMTAVVQLDPSCSFQNQNSMNSSIPFHILHHVFHILHIIFRAQLWIPAILPFEYNYHKLALLTGSSKESLVHTGCILSYTCCPLVSSV